MSSGNRHRRNDRRLQGHNENNSYRLFLAVEVPAQAISGLLDWQEAYLAADPVLRMTPAEQLHITLAFIGQAGDREKELAFTQLDEMPARDSFAATLTGLAGLPRGRFPRVIAARVEDLSGTLSVIHDDLTAGMVKKRIYKREKRPFFPHITIARARGRTKLDVAAINPEPIQFTAVRVTLYNSILKPSGALHKALKTVQLT
jgi:2'-5' RNA ligase